MLEEAFRARPGFRADKDASKKRQSRRRKFLGSTWPQITDLKDPERLTPHDDEVQRVLDSIQEALEQLRADVCEPDWMRLEAAQVGETELAELIAVAGNGSENLCLDFSRSLVEQPPRARVCSGVHRFWHNRRSSCESVWNTYV